MTTDEKIKQAAENYSRFEKESRGGEVKSLILKPHEVPRLLSGEQTMICRPMKVQPSSVCTIEKKTIAFNGSPDFLLENTKCPLGKVGDRVWCKETMFNDSY